MVSSPDLFQPRDGGPGGVNDVTSKKNIEASLMIVAYFHSVIYTWETSFRLVVSSPDLFQPRDGGPGGVNDVTSKKYRSISDDCSILSWCYIYLGNIIQTGGGWY